MAQAFIYTVFSKGRPEKVQDVRKLVGDLFKHVIWLVAKGDKKAYEKAGACSVKETGGQWHSGWPVALVASA